MNDVQVRAREVLRVGPVTWTSGGEGAFSVTIPKLPVELIEGQLAALTAAELRIVEADADDRWTEVLAVLREFVAFTDERELFRRTPGPIQRPDRRRGAAAGKRIYRRPGSRTHPNLSREHEPSSAPEGQGRGSEIRARSELSQRVKGNEL